MKFGNAIALVLFAATLWAAPAAVAMTVIDPGPVEDTFFFTLGNGGQLTEGSGVNGYQQPGGRLEEGGGTGWTFADYGPWFYYEPPLPTAPGVQPLQVEPEVWWYNQWYYDHPTVFDHYKIIDGWIYFLPTTNGASPNWALDVALNWSTPAYSTDVDEARDRPPNFQEEAFIEREVLLHADPNNTPEIQDGYFFVPFHLVIWDYNPEWVSIDIRGFNVQTPDIAFTGVNGEQIPGGFLTHECLPVPEPASFTLMGIGLGALALRYRRRRDA